MRELRSTVSTLAVIEAWNEQQRLRRTELVLTQWETDYFPPTVHYVRALTETERAKQDEFLGREREVWLGVFHLKQGLVAIGDDVAVLYRQAADLNVTLWRVH